MTSPFKFLDSYTKDDREIFFGREREIEELYHRVFESKIMLVYGVSGTGKSSLIHCGLANKFSETDWLPLVIRRGTNMIDSFAADISSASLTEQQSKFNNPGDFKKGVRSLYLDHYKPVFFIFDQFEELFIFGDKEERRTFIQIVKLLTESDLQCRFIFIMREEYMANISEFEKYIHTIFSNRVRIEKMSHMNAIDAIKGPCKVFNISLEEGFPETLLEKLSPGSEDVELTYLQVFLDKVFRLASNENNIDDKKNLSFTLPLLQRIGNVSDLLGSFLDDQITLMEDPDSAMTVLKAFVSGKGTKRPANEQEVIDNVRSFGKEIPHGTVKELIVSFVKLRVLRDKDDNGRYELRHDALAEKVYEKFSTAEKELLEIRQFIDNAYQTFLKRGLLLSNDDLTYISNKDSLLNLNPELYSFLDDSRKHIRAKIKTVRTLIFVSALSFLVLLAILIYFAFSRIINVKANYDAIKSITQVVDPKDRIKLAFSAWNSSPDVIPKEALIKAFNNILNSEIKDSVWNKISKELTISFEASPAAIDYACCSRDNSFIYGFSDSLVLVWSTKGQLINTFTSNHSPIIDIKMNRDNKYIGTVSCDSILEIRNIRGELQFERKISFNDLNTRQIFRFTQNDMIICLSPKQDAVLLDYNGHLIQTFNKHKEKVNSVDISENSNFIATASSDKTINIWYLNHVKNRYDFYNTLDNHTDTVWSATFSAAGTSILSASADGTIKVRSINNDYLADPRFPDNLKYCDAIFSDQEKGIIASLYLFDNNKQEIIYTAINYNNPSITLRPANTLSDQRNYYVFNSFECISFSSNEDYFIYSEGGSSYISDNRLTLEKNKANITANHNLLTLKGVKPFFTSDSKYAIVVDSNCLRAYFIDLETILKSLRKEELLIY
ncbi:MAG TPA: AAA family ATPase [Bacteroidales bacterium]|nr:AAA family ATPase [Bacteroidales bacterium]